MHRLGLEEASAREWVIERAIPDSLGKIIDYYTSPDTIVGFLPRASELAASPATGTFRLVPITNVDAEARASALRQADEAARAPLQTNGPSLSELEAQQHALALDFERRSRGVSAVSVSPRRLSRI